MISDQVTFRTKRSHLADDAEGAGWYFETEGVGSFGELKRDNTIQQGCEVRLRLRIDVVEDLVRWFDELKQHLRRLLVHVPCRFSLASSIPGVEGLVLDPGWTSSEADLGESLLAGLREDLIRERERLDLDIASYSRRTEYEAESHRIQDLIARAQQWVRWETLQGDLPEGLGDYRLHLPYFQLPGGSSITLLNVGEANDELFVEELAQSQGYAYVPPSRVITAWKGMAIQIGKQAASFPIQGIPPCVLEFNWTSSDAGPVSVSRG